MARLDDLTKGALVRGVLPDGAVKVVDKAELLRRVGGLGETAKELAYRLYVIREREKSGKEALAHNALVVAWPDISRLAAGASMPRSAQEGML